MSAIDDIDRERLQRQLALDGAKAQLERNQMGQFATPDVLALEMARLAKELWKPKTLPIHFLDPSLGLGAFYSALRRVFPDRLIASAKGVELDPDFARAAHSLWAGSDLRVTRADFTKTTAPADGEKANLLIANPPYVRHHHLDAEDKVRLQQSIATSLRLRVNGLAGLYVYFLLLCDRWMASDGLALWLIPSEFLDVNYGEVVRTYLRERVTLLRLHRFDPKDVQFADALVSSTVIVFRKASPAPDHEVLFTYGGSLLKPRRRMSVRHTELDPRVKWSAYPNINGTTQPHVGARLSNFFSIRRGIATGANEVFILPRSRAQSLQLEEKYLRPILPSPRNLKTSVVESHADGYPDLADQLVVIDCAVATERLAHEAPHLFQYLRSSTARGIQGRYLCQKRTPWYRQEHREPPPFLSTYMGRGVGDTKPFRFIWNKSAAIAANVYLLLYPIGHMKRALERDPGLYATIFQLLGEIDADALRAGGRVYGGALHKLEPKELGNFPADTFAAAIGPHAEEPTQYQPFAREMKPHKIRETAKIGVA